jgi:hypothetical protein
LKLFAYILSVLFLFSIVSSTPVALKTTQTKEKKEQTEQISATSSQVVVPLVDIKLSQPFEFLVFDCKAYFVEFFPSQYTISFVDKYLKILLLCIISPHAP